MSIELVGWCGRRLRRRVAVGWLPAWVVLLTWVAPASLAAGGTPAVVLRSGPDHLQWWPLLPSEAATLSLAAPDGTVRTVAFGPGVAPMLGLYDAAGQPLPDGVYTWEVRLYPRGAPAERVAGGVPGEEAGAAERRRRPAGAPRVESGSFAVEEGRFVAGEEPEPGEAGAAAEQLPALRPAVAADQLVPDDLIVDGKACVGLGCASNESFGNEALRLKQAVVRIRFEDTSTAGGFAARDWQLTVNEVGSGGADKLSIEDLTAGTTPFTIRGGAPSNALYVDQPLGRVGLGTATPAQSLHVAALASPTVRLEQTGAPERTWDIVASPLSFAVTDVTGGSKVPFRVAANAPTSSLEIGANGHLGIGIANPSQELTVKSRAANQNVVEVLRSQADNQVIVRLFETTAGAGLMSFYNSGASETFRLTGSGGHSWFSGTLGLNCIDGAGFDFSIKSGFSSTTACNTGTFSQIDAGQTSFTVASSRALKENVRPVSTADILDRIAEVGVYTYDFVEGAKDKMGLMAEDFHRVFGRGSERLINGQEVEMALWLAVQELAKRDADQRVELVRQSRRIEEQHQLLAGQRALLDRQSALIEELRGRLLSREADTP